MTDSLAPTPGSDPQDGDLVVTGDTSHSRRYAVRQLPGPVQFTTSTRNEAIRLVRGFARTRRVNIWWCAQNGTGHLLETYRPATNLRSRHARPSR